MEICLFILKNVNVFITTIIFRRKYYQIKSIKCLPLTHICDLRWYMGNLCILMQTKTHYNLKNFTRFRILKFNNIGPKDMF